MIDADVVCECGITCARSEVDGAVHFYCPRCQKSLPDPARCFEGVGMALVECVDGGWQHLCENCGTPMSDACWAKCPGCGWEHPCG